MKKDIERFLTIVAIGILFVFVGGCGYTSTVQAEESTDKSTSSSFEPINVDMAYYEDEREVIKNHIWCITDEKTGVQYVVYSQTFYHGGAGGITVRVNADGTPYIDPDFVPSDTGFTVMEGE